jgi:hypothetical protein
MSKFSILILSHAQVGINIYNFELEQVYLSLIIVSNNETANVISYLFLCMPLLKF